MTQTAIVGLGGYGVNFINHFKKEKRENFIFIASDTDEQNLKRLKEKEVISGTFEAKELVQKIEQFKQVFLVVGLGGNYGSQKVLELAKELSEKDIDVQVVATKPFVWEGRIRTKAAEKTEKELQKIDVPTDIFGNEKLREYLKEQNRNFSTTEAFNIVDDYIKEIILKGTGEKELV